MSGSLATERSRLVSDTERVAVLRSFNVLDTGPEAAFDDLTRLAAQLCDAPMALVSLVDTDRQWFKSALGIDLCGTPRADSFCAHALHSETVMVVPNAPLDPRFTDNPFVTGAPYIRFYAGAPLVADGGYVLGTLCVLDVVARELTPTQTDQLAALARQVVGQLRLRRQAAELEASVAASKTAQQSLAKTERQWHAVFTGSPVGISLSDEHGLFAAANGALCNLLGRAEGDLIGRSSADFTHPDDLASQRAVDQLISASPDGVVRIEKRYVRPSGEVRWAWLTLTHTPGPEGQDWMLAHVQDITERKVIEQAVVDSEANLNAVARVVQKIQSGADARNTIVEAGLELAQAAYASLVEPTADGSALTVTSSTESGLVGTELAIGGSTASAQVYASGQALFISDRASSELGLSAPRLLIEATSVYAVPVFSADTVTAVLLVAWKHRIPDIDDKRARVVTLLADHAGLALRQAVLVSRLESLALTDSLTALPNRRSWDEHLARLMVTALRRGEPLTVALADLDHFKKFNDTHGHTAGDELLASFATLGSANIRADDVMARWGGEEFTFALPNCPEREARSVLDRVRRATPGGETCSIGAATWDGNESADALLARADAALYRAKGDGRNAVVLA
jgi:diguanylate cyclase (GGDEF)-like protein/PAS domain S-box-containing protein